MSSTTIHVAAPTPEALIDAVTETRHRVSDYARATGAATFALHVIERELDAIQRRIDEGCPESATSAICYARETIARVRAEHPSLRYSE